MCCEARAARMQQQRPHAEAGNSAAHLVEQAILGQVRGDLGRQDDVPAGRSGGGAVWFGGRRARERGGWRALPALLHRTCTRRRRQSTSPSTVSGCAPWLGDQGPPRRRSRGLSARAGGRRDRCEREGGARAQRDGRARVVLCAVRVRRTRAVIAAGAARCGTENGCGASRGRRARDVERSNERESRSART